MEPILFVAHGSPMLALDSDPYADFLSQFGQTLHPDRILVVSAHWTRRGQSVTGALRHHVVYDFSGFPPDLYRLTYQAPGDERLVSDTAECLDRIGVPLQIDQTRGLDHGAWVILRRLFPAANIPVVELSVDPSRSPAELFAVGQALASLAGTSTLLIGSGGTVHNLAALDGSSAGGPAPWALAFDEWLGRTLMAWDMPAVLRYREEAPEADWAVPPAGTEHFLPLLYVLGAADGAGFRTARRLVQHYQMGSLSLAVWQFSPA